MLLRGWRHLVYGYSSRSRRRPRRCPYSTRLLTVVGLNAEVQGNWGGTALSAGDNIVFGAGPTRQKTSPSRRSRILSPPRGTWE
jgi:hypothetical protein